MSVAEAEKPCATTTPGCGPSMANGVTTWIGTPPMRTVCQLSPRFAARRPATAIAARTSATMPAAAGQTHRRRGTPTRYSPLYPQQCPVAAAGWDGRADGVEWANGPG